MASKVIKVAAEAAREELDHPRNLLRLAELALVDRKWRIVERRIRARPSVRRPCKLTGLRFPAVKSFDTFDFAAIPSLNQPLVPAAREYVVARNDVLISS